jgi:hypothetical protein
MSVSISQENSRILYIIVAGEARREIGAVKAVILPVHPFAAPRLRTGFCSYTGCETNGGLRRESAIRVYRQKKTARLHGRFVICLYGL